MRHNVRSAAVAASAAALIVAAACAGAAAPHAMRGAGYVQRVPLGLDPVVPTPPDNTPTSARVRLGELLFNEPLLSRDGTRTCASCHRAEFAFGDSSIVSRGVDEQPTLRNAPPLINSAWGRVFFRDGRAASLEEAVVQPILDPRELALSRAELVDRLNRSSAYRRRFEQAYGAQDITADVVAKALAAYIRVLQSANSAFDRFQAGDSSALTPEQQHGRTLFLGRANCARCHVGPNLTDAEFHNTGVATRSGDDGRYSVTHRESDRGAFLTPTLRNISRTAPYMHDGSFRTLEAVVDFYSDGAIPNALRDFQIQPLNLTAAEKAALLAFLRAL